MFHNHLKGPSWVSRVVGMTLYWSGDERAEHHPPRYLNETVQSERNHHGLQAQSVVNGACRGRSSGSLWWTHVPLSWRWKWSWTIMSYHTIQGQNCHGESRFWTVLDIFTDNFLLTARCRIARRIRWTCSSSILRWFRPKYSWCAFDQPVSTPILCYSFEFGQTKGYLLVISGCFCWFLFSCCSIWESSLIFPFLSSVIAEHHVYKNQYNTLSRTRCMDWFCDLRTTLYRLPTTLSMYLCN